MAKARGAKPNSIEAERAKTQAYAHVKWTHRHPQLAREERSFRKERDEQLRKFSHKRNGTPETHHHASQVRQGAIARLYNSGRLAIEEVAWAQEIRTVAERIGADVAVSTASLETRVDTSRHGDAFWEALGAVRAEVAYSRWRAQLGGRAAIALDIIVEDAAVTEVARRYRVSARKAGAFLEEALGLWGRLIQQACKEIDAATLAAAQAGIL